MTEHSAEKDAGLIPLVRALWLAHNEADEIPLDLAWDDLPEPQRTNWLAVGKAARARGVCVLPSVETEENHA